MEITDKKKDDIAAYIKEQERTANDYVMKCLTATIIVYNVIFVLNLLNIFIVDTELMTPAYLLSMTIYVVVYMVKMFVLKDSWKLKYFMLFCIVVIFTITGVFLTYHAILLTILPFLYATLYSSKKVMYYVYILTVVSTILVVYGGYYVGVCDANMVLLTASGLSEYVVDGKFVLTEVNNNPIWTLFAYFVVPRGILYVAFMVICNSINNLLSSTLERAQMSVELEEAKINAENANRAKSQFLAKMSHEIRTPINAVLGMNEMIINESSEEEVRQYAHDVKNSSLILLDIVNEILDSSKIESGMMEIEPVEYQIEDMLESLYNMINLRAREKNLELRFEVDKTMPKMYYGDDKRIRQVLVNILTNAVKYTNSGEVVLSVNCRVEGNDAYMHYSVKDTGIGIKPENIEKIYDAFQRFDTSRNRNVEGTGLGMNITQQLLKLMNSELKIESEYEKGSEFSFVIVQKIVDASPIQQNTAEKKPAAREGVRNVCMAENAKVLVVDDNLVNLKVFVGLMKPTKAQVTTALSGQECLGLVEKNSYDIIFMDHMMPEMDGIETFREIKERKLCENVPVIMLTANAIVGDREKYLAEGFDDFLSKPIMVDKLDAVIEKYLSSRQEDEKQEDVKSVMTDKLIDMIDKKIAEINVATGLETCSGDEDFYKELLDDFVKLPIKDELERFFGEKNNKDYNIRIHGFKNAAYYIGAKGLGDMAFEMEKMTREGLPQELEALHKKFMADYDKICEQYRELRDSGM